jgi:alpha-aminoadipic semialdehyde synthase
MRIGIRREDKNEFEARVPLTPDAARQLISDGIEVWLQPSRIRAYPDDVYKDAGAVISEDLSSCPVVVAVKEMPSDFFGPKKTYLFFSHTIKGQAYNMPMLRRLMELECQLLDYELVTDDDGRRLIFFGNYAGLAGMIDSLWALGKRLEWEGKPSALGEVKQAYQYGSLEDAREHIGDVGKKIASEGLPPEVAPLICGFAGYGNVSQRAQEIFDLLPNEEIAPSEVAALASAGRSEVKKLYKVVFKEEHLVEPVDASTTFELQDYYDHPEKYRSQFERYLPHLTVLVNCIYWEPRYPRLVTLDYLREAWSAPSPPPLRVIGDITCDIDGSVQSTVKATESGNPVYVYNPLTGEATDGHRGDGPIVLAVDNLPCELPKESSEFFSRALLKFIPQLLAADMTASFDKLDLPPPLHRATILHQGKLTPNFTHLSKYL